MIILCLWFPYRSFLYRTFNLSCTHQCITKSDFIHRRLQLLSHTRLFVLHVPIYVTFFNRTFSSPFNVFTSLDLCRSSTAFSSERSSACFRLLTKTLFSAFKASLGLRLGCGLLLGAFWTGDPTETDVSTLALLSLGETVSMVRLIIPEDGGFSTKPRVVPLELLGIGSLFALMPKSKRLYIAFWKDMMNIHQPSTYVAIFSFH